MMLRELQKLLADERRNKERLETSINEVQAKLKTAELTEKGKRKEEKDRKVHELEMKLRLKSEELDKLKDDFEETKQMSEQFQRENRQLRVNNLFLIHESVPTFQNFAKQNNFQDKIVIGTGGAVDLAE